MHSYSPDLPCTPCAANFPLGSSGCHRLNPKLTGARYLDDPDSMKRNGERTEQKTSDPWSGA